MTNKKILFIEDERDQISLIQTRLESSGFEFIFAMNGEEGLKKVNDEKPDLILLDLVMPKMDGYEVCKRIKEDPAIDKIPIIILTASGVQGLEKKCIALGADGVIMKPYDSTELVAKIKALLKD